MSRSIASGSTSQSTVIRVYNASTGVVENAMTAATAGLALSYRREGAANVTITPSDLAALTTAWSAGGLKLIGNGYYRLDVADAAFAAGVDGVLIHGTATGLQIEGAYHPLVAVLSPLDAAGVRSAVGLASANLDTQLTAIDDYIDTEVAAIKAKTDNLPAAFPANFASLAITATGAVGINWGNVENPSTTIQFLNTVIGTVVTTATVTNPVTVSNYTDIADGVWDDLFSAHTTPGTFGYNVGQLLDAAVSGIPAAWGASVIGNGRTRDYFLQGGFNKTVRTANAFAVYSTDDTTQLATAVLTEDGALNPMASVDPT